MIDRFWSGVHEAPTDEGERVKKALSVDGWVFMRSQRLG